MGISSNRGNAASTHWPVDKTRRTPIAALLPHFCRLPGALSPRSGRGPGVGGSGHRPGTRLWDIGGGGRRPLYSRASAGGDGGCRAGPGPHGRGPAGLYSRPWRWLDAVAERSFSLYDRMEVFVKPRLQPLLHSTALVQEDTNCLQPGGAPWIACERPCRIYVRFSLCTTRTKVVGGPVMCNPSASKIRQSSMS